MKKTSSIRTWMQKSSLLLTALAVCSGTALAQPSNNYWTVFGNPAATGSGCNTYNSMSCLTSPSSSSFSGVMTASVTAGTPYDPSILEYYFDCYYNTSFQNSMYDASGDLFFAVNADGIWAPDGTEIYDFTSSDMDYISTACGDVYYAGAPSLSEICIIPNNATCNSYYVIFWGGLNGVAYPTSHVYTSSSVVLRAIEVDIDPTGFSAGHYSTCYTCTSNLLDIPECTCSGCYTYNNFSLNTGSCEVAVNPNPDGSYDIYTIDNEYNTTTHSYNGALRKWPISATGVLPQYTASAMPAPISANVLNPAATNKAKLFNIPHPTGGTTDLVFAYVGCRQSVASFANVLQTYNLTTNDIEGYIPPSSGSEAGWQNICGFEYMKTGSSQPTYIFTYEDVYLTGVYTTLYGGFGYAYPGYGLTSPVTITSISSQPEYSRSDLELNFNGDLYCVNDPSLGATNTLLAYIPRASLGSIISSFTAPTLSTASCSSNVSTWNWQYESYEALKYSYLGSQIRGACTSGTPTFTLTASSTSLCPAAAPTFTATGVFNPCGVVYSWYKSLGGSNPYSLFKSCEGCNTATDVYATDREQIYCQVSLPVPSIGFCGTSTSLYTNTVTISVANMQILDVDINKICYDDALKPVYSVTVTGGTPPYLYTWAPAPGNTTSLNSYSVATPTVTGSGIAEVAIFTLTATDAHYCTATRTVFTQFNNNESYDLASRDSYFDMYDEGNSQTSYNTSGIVNSYSWCNSPDIVNRLNPDGIFVGEQPLYSRGHYNYLYIKVRNVGCLNYLGTAVPGYSIPTLNTYWTIGGFGGAEAWNDDSHERNFWTNQYALSITGTPIPLGLNIGSVDIPPIAAGSYTVIPIPITGGWTPPDPSSYTSAFNVVPTHSPITMDLCFLSRIVDYHNMTGSDPDPIFGMTYAEGTDADDNTLANNNIVTLNTSVMDFSNYSYPTHREADHYLYVGNLATTAQTYSLQFANTNSITTGAGGSVLSSYIYIKVYLGPLFELWETGGALGTYDSVNYNEKYVIFDGSHLVQLDNITIPADTEYIVHLACYEQPGMDMSTMSQENITFSELNGQGQPTGMYTYTTMYNPNPNPQGVLAVSEISQGPSNYTGCEYAEMIVGNCDSDASLNVDVSGWIIDDNDGSFDTGSCTATGITAGHYRLAYNNIWQSIQVGSRIVVYNAANNCYNLPDTFFVDSVNGIYWVPVPGTQPANTYAIERYGDAENGSDTTNYCSDTGTTVYTPAYGWEQTIALAPEDAIQVRCPGCAAAYPTKPAFYHGIGYAPDTTYCFDAISAGTYSLGGPVEYNNSGNQKYIFTGSAAADLGDPTKWAAYNADAAGSPPATLGYVDSALYYGVFLHTFGLPCCNYSGDGSRHSNPNTNNTAPGANTPQGISVYPNPVNSTLYFVFPASANTTIKLMDVTGRLIAQQVLYNTTNANFNVYGYTPGVYLYQVVTNGVTKTGKVVVSH